MNAVAGGTDALHVEDLLVGALAVLALQGITTLRTTDRSFHEHFGKALEVFKNSGGRLGELARRYYRDVVSQTYEALDDALITAEQFGFVKFPNPTYSRLQIAMTPRVARRLLEEIGAEHRGVFETAAKELKDSVNA